MASIRTAIGADADELDLMVRELAAHEGSLEHVHVDATAWRALLSRQDVTVLIAEEAGQPVGFTSMVRRVHLWTGGDVLALDDLYVRESARNSGVGRRLMAAVAAEAAPDGLTVTWGVRLDNDAGQRFYRRLGASLKTKVVASWAPDQYAWAVETS